MGVTGNNRVPITSVDKLAEQNGHKAELQALRQEANRGDEIHKGYYISQFIFNIQFLYPRARRTEMKFFASL